jgi:ribosomal protein L37AE/L43A
MEAVAMSLTEKAKAGKAVVLCERRTSSHEHCPACGSRRKTWVADLGWICTSCFDQCKEAAELVVEAGSGVTRLRQAYELAICSYRAEHVAPVDHQSAASSDLI